MENNPSSRWIFDEAAGHVYQLMKNDSYPRYLRSDMYKEYLNGTKKKVRAVRALLIDEKLFIHLTICFFSGSLLQTSVKGFRGVITNFSGKKVGEQLAQNATNTSSVT